MKIDSIIGSLAGEESVDNFSIGEVTAVDDSGICTVKLSDGISIKVVNAGEANIDVGDFVALRLIGGDINNAEIAGKTARSIKGKARVIWR
jgi:hypothetical protein